MLSRTIRVSSFDFDNCIFHIDYIWDKNKPNEYSVILENSEFLETIRSQNHFFDDNICLVGSNRQSKATDDELSDFKPAPTESCFAAIEKLSAFLDARLDPFLMADIYGNLPSGTSFYKARSPQSNRLKHANWVFDKSKLSILYAQMHKIASEYPNDEIIFDFYDDKRAGAFDGKMEALLENLERFFTRHPEMIPKNVTLRLHHYAGKEVTPYQPIKGQGIIDTGYRNTVLEMAKLAGAYSAQRHPMYSFIDSVLPEKLKSRSFLIYTKIQQCMRHGYANFFNPFKASLGTSTDTTAGFDEKRTSTSRP